MFCGNPERIDPMKFRLFFSAMTFVLPITSLLGKPLGYCPTGAPQACKNSLPQAVRLLTNCPLHSTDTLQCGRVFVETLSAADPNAPYYIGFYEKNFEIGNEAAYRKILDALKRANPAAIQTIYQLSKAIVLQYIDINSLSDEKKRELENMIQNIFRAVEGVDFSLSSQQNRDDFISLSRTRAQNISWPTTLSASESRIIE